ncbi:MAG TPA: methionyl-tRNA formyltransferase [Afifellaceae bacterium]|nr:methionyl-tRNA formyltransferase [Afifellaceae bacterium]
MRLVFMGTPAFAVPTLTEIVGRGHEIAAIYTQPPRPAGRGMNERRSPVHEAAARFGLPVHTPRSLRDAAVQDSFAGHAADAAIVVAYGLILPPPILAAPRQGCLNLHASLLPRWRGAAPIQRAIMAGDSETGVSIMRMAEGLDTGPVCLTERVAIDADDTASKLHDRLARLGADLMARALAAIERGSLDCVPQPDDGAVYAAKIDKAEARIDWSRPAGEVHDLIRGLSPHPGAWCEMSVGGNAERVKVLRSALAGGSGPPGTMLDDDLTVACGEGAVRLIELQRPGRRPVEMAEFLRGVRGAVAVVR